MAIQMFLFYYKYKFDIQRHVGIIIFLQEYNHLQSREVDGFSDGGNNSSLSEIF